MTNNLSEQETTINIDYLQCIVDLYTSKQSVASKLKHYLGEPTKTYKTKKEITGVRYIKGFNDKDVKKLLSKTIIIATNGKNRKETKNNE